MRKPFIKSLGSIPVEDAHGGSGKRQLILSKADSISRYLDAMTKGFLKAGGVFDWHVHEELDEFFLVEKGSGSIHFRNGEAWDYKKGDLVYVPSGVEHIIEAKGDTDNEFFFIRLKSE